MSSKLKESLDKIGNISAFVAENCGNSDTAKYMNDIISIVQETLAEPLRNCDVGTVREQDLRFDDFCGHNGCDKCPLKETSEDCVLGWAHMPYEREVKS